MSYELRRTIPARWAHLGAMHTFDRRDLHAVGEYLCINDLAPAHGRPLVCCINGEYVSRLDWWQPVRVGDVVVFLEVAHGGGGSNPLRILATIAVLVAATFVPGALGFAAGSLGAAAATAATVTIGTLLVNAAFPVDTSQGGGGVQQASPTYSVSLQGNNPRLGSPVPVRYGQEKFFPDHACAPYVEFSGTNFDQYYCVGLSIGLGEYDVLAIEIDDTPVQNFRDVEVVIIGPGMTGRAQPTGYTAQETFAAQTIIETGMVTSAEVSGQDLRDAEWVGPFTALKSGWSADRIFVDLVFPRGVGSVDSSGDIDNRTISWQVQAQEIDDAGSSVGAWTLLATESYTGNTTQQVRLSYEYTVTAARYRVRVRRVSARSDNDRHLNDMQWAQLRTRLSIGGIARTDLTGIALRIRSSSQLSGLTQRRIRVMARRLVSVYNSGTATWGAVEFSRNPAWALADIWRNGVYGRRLADDRIDLESLTEYAAVWTTRQDRFDYSFDTQHTTDDAAQLVAATGRARTMFRRGSVYSLVRDELQSDPVAVFMPRNMDGDSFGLSFALATSETPDALRVSYRDGRYWDERYVYAQAFGGAIYGYACNASGIPLRPSGVDAPSVVEEFDLKGVVGEKQAIRTAVYLLARSIYRREEGSFTADIDGLLCSMGSLIGIAHDAAEWGQSGDVVDWDLATLTLTVSEPPAWTVGGTHYVRLQSYTGGVDGAIEVTPGATDFEMVLASAPGVTPSFEDARRERTRYLFGELADVQRYAVIAGVRPVSMDEMEMPFFLEDNRVHSADAAWLPTGAEIQDPLSDGATTDDAEAAGFTEDFEAYADETAMNATYSLVAGTDFVTLETGTNYGKSLRIHSINSGTVHRYRRALPADLTAFDIRVKFMLTPTLEEDDAGMLILRDTTSSANCGGAGSAAGDRIHINPRRDSDFSPSRSFEINLMNGERQRFAAGLLVADVWYSLRLLIIAGAGNTSATITRISDNDIIASVGFTGDHSPVFVNQLEWRADSGGTTGSAQYDDLTIN